jgi:hypothetical protein
VRAKNRNRGSGRKSSGFSRSDHSGESGVDHNSVTVSITGDERSLHRKRSIYEKIYLPIGWRRFICGLRTERNHRHESARGKEGDKHDCDKRVARSVDQDGDEHDDQYKRFSVAFSLGLSWGV